MNNKPNRPSADTIFEILRDRICLLHYPPGSLLREATLAEEFDVSRTPMRAILQRLTHGGLIISRDGVGTIVTELSNSELKDIYQMRMKMAEMIGQMTPRPFSKSQQSQAAILLARSLKIVDTFDINEYWQINHDLHFLIMDVIGNSALRHMWDHYYYLAARMWYKKTQETSDGVADLLVAELHEISRAIKEGDAIALGFSQRNYIAYGMVRL